MELSLKPLCSKWDNGSIGEDDYDYLCQFFGNILEFGPGNSTFAFLEAKNTVISIEYNTRWFRYWSERLPNKILRRPLPSWYDMIYVDAPHGDRWKECQWAMKHTNHIILHDAKLPENQRVAEIFKIRHWTVKLIETHHGIYDFTKR